MKIPSLVFTGCALLQLSACANVAEAPEDMTWEEFEAQTYHEPWENGVYIVDGDVPVVGEAALRELFEQRSQDDGALGMQSSALAVLTDNGRDVRWTDAQKMNITYCISDTFGARKSALINAMNAATASWEQGGYVNFIHLTQYDSNCTASQQNVVFDIRPISGADYIARSFFPNQARPTRNMLLNSTAFEGALNLTSVVRHELGHTLGFRHENTRPESQGCFEDNNWRALTTYDSASVMMMCNGVIGTDLTATDREGLAALYGAPPDDDEGTETTWTASGSLARDAWRQAGPFPVVPGSTVRAVTSGTGDVDLYVRFTNPPTSSAYNCRSWQEGSSETCTLTVPTGVTRAYVGVRGYGPTNTYRLTVTYVAP